MPPTSDSPQTNGYSVDSSGALGPAGRQEEFLALLTRHKYELFNLIFCIVRSLPDTEDVFQQTAMALWSDFGKFRTGSDFVAWASQVARYRAWNFARTKRRERMFFSEPLTRQLAECSFDAPEVRESRLQALSACRQKLSAADQQLLQLCYEGDSMREVAEQVGRPLAAVYGRLFRIRKALCECIERTLAREGRA